MVTSKGDLRRLEERVLNGRLPVVTRTDYIEDPRVSGYRGVHIVVKYQDRNIEIQLRTQTMHDWALATESFSQLMGENYKQDGDHPIQLFLRVASDMMALREDGKTIPLEMLELHAQRRIDAQPYLQGGTP